MLECLGAPAELAGHPEAFLDAWSKYDGKNCPAMPRVLRRALADPQRAGQPPDDKRAEVEAMAAAALDRAVQTGPLDPLPSVPSRPLSACTSPRARAPSARLACARGSPAPHSHL